MRQFAICYSLAAIALADQIDFPKDDVLHSDCHLTATFKKHTCNELYTYIYNELDSWKTEQLSPTGGVFQILESEENIYIWSQRLNKESAEPDDHLFVFEPTMNEKGCSVAAHFRGAIVDHYHFPM